MTRRTLIFAAPVLAAALIIAAAADALAQQEHPFSDVFAKVAPAVGRVVAGRGHASAIVVSADGLVVTHRDVVRRNRLSVVFADGRKFSAKPLLRDERTQLAVLRIVPDEEPQDAPPADPNSPAAPKTDRSKTSAAPPALPLGASGDLRPGAWVATVAYPMGADLKTRTRPSLSAGLLTARGKIPVGLDYDGELLLTDAATNAGSEGGALVDVQGRLVGILCQPQYHPETKTALNVALPVEVLGALLERARENPDPPVGSNGFLGVQGGPGGDECTIAGVVKDGPAEKAGLKAKDVITRINERPVASFAELVEVLKKTQPGDTVRLTVRRPGRDKPIELEVELGEYPEEE